MRAFLTLLQTDGPRARGESVCELFFDDPWFQDLVALCAAKAVAANAVPGDWREDVEQEIWLLFLQKAVKTPDLRVNLEVVEGHFGGWIWTIIDRLGFEAIGRLHRFYRFDGDFSEDVASSAKWHIETKIDLSLLVADLPPLTRTILVFFSQGYTLKEVAGIVEEPYWRVCEHYREAVQFLRDRLAD